MRKFLTLIPAAALLATPAFAEARGFDSEFSQAVTGPFKLEVVVSEDLAHRANNLPEKLSDRGSSRRLNASFSNNGRYGEREIEYLIEDMQEELVQDFAKRGLTISDDASTLLRVTINEVKNNRPTYNQLRTDSSLSLQSFAIGGADVSAEFISAGGAVVGTADYDYFSSFNDRPLQGLSTWSDATRSFSRFSKKLSKKLAAMDAASS